MCYSCIDVYTRRDIMYKENKRVGYTCIGNNILQSDNLTLEARGLLCYMMSCPPNWVFNTKTLCSGTHEKRTKIENCVNQLMRLGYISRKVVREDGKIKYYTFDINTDRDFSSVDKLPFD